jgi:hypothetical protein
MPRAKTSVYRGYAKFCAKASIGRMREYLPVFSALMCTLPYYVSPSILGDLAEFVVEIL